MIKGTNGMSQSATKTYFKTSYIFPKGLHCSWNEIDLFKGLAEWLCWGCAENHFSRMFDNAVIFTP